MNQPQNAIQNAILDACRRLVSMVHSASRASEKQIGLSAAQLFVLKKLADGSPRSINEIAELTHTHQSSVSVVVKKLLEKKLVLSRSSPSDARRLELTLSSQGKKILDLSPESVQDRLITAIQTLGPEDALELKRLLEKLLSEAYALDKPVPLFLEGEGDD